MRLLIAMQGTGKAQAIERALEDRGHMWNIHLAQDGEMALEALGTQRFDLLLLHSLLPKIDGPEVLQRLWQKPPACPPRVLMLAEPELSKKASLRADCVTTLLASPERLAALLDILSQKKRPGLSAALADLRRERIAALISSLGLRPALKGSAYIAWMLEQLIPAPQLEHEITATLYPSCAAAFDTSPAAVERCVRHAVEAVFTHGNMQGIEKYFGATVDPERGKPTNRAFLICAAEQVRDSINPLPGPAPQRA